MRCRIKMAVFCVIALAAFLASCTYMKGFSGASYGAAAALDKNAALAHYRLAVLYQKAGRQAEAIDEFRKAVGMEPGFAMAWNALGVSYDREGDFRSAVSSYREAISVFSASGPGSNIMLGYIYNNLGYSYLLRKDAQRAAEALKKAVALNKGNKQAHNNLALAYAMEGHAGPAMDEFLIAGGETSAHMNMARIYYGQGNFTEAKKQYLLALAADPKCEAAKAGLKASAALAAVEETPDKAAPPEPSQMKPVHRASACAGREPATFLFSGAGKIRKARRRIAENKTVRIEISNGNGVRDMAKMVGIYLRRKGFDVTRLTNADNFAHTKTVLFFRDGYLESALGVSRAIPASRKLFFSRKLGRGIKVKLLIGRDIARFRAVYFGGRRLRAALRGRGRYGQKRS